MEELNARQLPQSLEAEQAVLGSILIDSRCLTDVIGILRPEDFYLEQNGQIYQTIYTMFNFSQTIDPVTVLDKMKELGYVVVSEQWCKNDSALAASQMESILEPGTKVSLAMNLKKINIFTKDGDRNLLQGVENQAE